MKYEMPALTDEMRNDFIEDLQWAIKDLTERLSLPHEETLSSAALEYQLIVQKIALASLTAEPEDGLFIRGVELSPVKGRRTISQATPMPNGEFHHSCFEMYTAPPVPAMKLPQYVDSSNIPFAANGWNACIDEFKRLNGVKDD